MKINKIFFSARLLIFLPIIATSQVAIQEAFPNLYFTEPVDLQHAPDRLETKTWAALRPVMISFESMFSK